MISTLLDKHRPLIEQLMSTVFPVTLSEKDDLYGGSVPFQMQMFYASRRMQQEFLESDGHNIIMPDCATEERVTDDKIIGAYQMILNRFFNANINNGVIHSVYNFKCAETGLDKYMELELDSRFIDIRAKGDLPKPAY